MLMDIELELVLAGGVRGTPGDNESRFGNIESQWKEHSSILVYLAHKVSFYFLYIERKLGGAFYCCISQTAWKCARSVC